MGRRQDKANKIDKTGMKQILGRIFRPRHEDNGAERFLIVKDGSMKVRLDLVIHCIKSNPEADDQAIVGHLSQQHSIHGVRPADVENVRAYIHRFGSDLFYPLSINDHPVRTLLLDENMPQLATLRLSQSFGWATHVSAEGLAGRDTPDENIWEFACDNKFCAIVTRDTDFLEIQKRRTDKATMTDDVTVPLLVFVEGNVSAESVTGIFSRHKRSIQGHMRDMNHLAIAVNENTAPKPLF